MARNLTASDRKSLIRLASTMEPGSPERRAILVGLAKRAAESFDSFESGEVYRREALSLIEKLGRRHGIKVNKVTNSVAIGQKVDGDGFTDFRWELVLPPTGDPKRQEVEIGYLNRSGFAAFRRPKSLGYFDVSRLSPEQLVKKHLLNVILTGSSAPPPPSKKRRKLPKRLQDFRLASTLPVGSPERKAILNGLERMAAAGASETIKPQFTVAVTDVRPFYGEGSLRVKGRMTGQNNIGSEDATPFECRVSFVEATGLFVVDEIYKPRVYTPAFISLLNVAFSSGKIQVELGAVRAFSENYLFPNVPR